MASELWYHFTFIIRSQLGLHSNRILLIVPTLQIIACLIRTLLHHHLKVLCVHSHYQFTLKIKTCQPQFTRAICNFDSEYVSDITCLEILATLLATIAFTFLCDLFLAVLVRACVIVAALAVDKGYLSCCLIVNCIRGEILFLSSDIQNRNMSVLPISSLEHNNTVREIASFRDFKLLEILVFLRSLIRIKQRGLRVKRKGLIVVILSYYSTFDANDVSFKDLRVVAHVSPKCYAN